MTEKNPSEYNLNKDYRQKQIDKIKRLRRTEITEREYDTVSDLDVTIDKIVCSIYDCGYNDGFSDSESEDRDSDREPMYNEGYD